MTPASRQPVVDVGGTHPADVVIHGVLIEGRAVLSDRLRVLAERTGFTAELGSAATTLRPDGDVLDVLVGLGPSDLLDVEALRIAARAAAAHVAFAALAAVDLAAVAAPTLGRVAAVHAVVEGLAGAGGGPRVVLSGLGPDGGTEADDSGVVRRAQLTAEAVELARQLVDGHPGAVTPSTMAEHAVTVAEREGLDVEVWEPDRLAAERMGGLLAIGRGSDASPRYVKLSWRPAGARRTVALVGKGITFDSGGLSLKSPDAMEDMKLDMAGAAAVLGAMSVLRRLEVPVEVTAHLALAENLPGPGAVRAGEVVATRNGLTVEVRNTDFEGRVVLADALAVASEARPDLLVDLATLTDACTVALGDDIAGVLGGDDAVAAVLAAARVAGEPMWRLPMARRYEPRLRSAVADLSNHPGNRTGRAITAALFLERFVRQGVPWAHLDLVGPSWRPGTGATGFGVRTVLRLLE